MSISRRAFLQASALSCGSTTFLWPEATQICQAAESPLEKIRLGCIGFGGQGLHHLGILSKNVVALCDVDSGHLKVAQSRMEKANVKCTAYGDYRKLLDNKDVDAVVVCTPDHWHARITVDACDAGKHVYCEKPLTLTVAEGRAIVNAARRSKRIVQTGSQQRSAGNFRLACELVQSGYLGKLKAVKVGIPGPNFKGPAVADSPAPKELDYDFWLGPAPQRPFNSKRVHYLFRFFWDYSGGQMTNWGAHHLDIAQWGLGMDNSGPVSIEGTATFHPQKWFETPVQQEIVYTYANGVILTCSMTEKGGTTFLGEKGFIRVNRGVFETDLPGITTKTKLKDSDIHLYVSTNHHTNWFDCIRSGKLPVCDAEVGHRSATVCHLGNISCRLGRKINWDPMNETISNDKEAAAMLSRPYREPWKSPT